jgi:hypothetical protein
MSDQELDAVYTELCQTLGEAGEEAALKVLGRFALLAMIEIDDAERLKVLIARAATAG